MWNHLNVRKKSSLKTCYLAKKNHHGIDNGLYEKWATAHRQPMVFQVFTTTYISLPS